MEFSAFVHIEIGTRTMHRTTIIPNDQITKLPMMPILKARVEREVVQLVQQGIAFR